MQRSSGSEPVGARAPATLPPVPPHAAARIPGEPIAECVESTGQRAVHSRAADHAWRHTFDVAGREPPAEILLRPSHEAMPTAFPRSADG
jgi:hypothetical protein